jgi:hypothetical protein
MKSDERLRVKASPEFDSDPRFAGYAATLRTLADLYREPWDHPYDAGADNVCVHCGRVGSYAHTDPSDLD